MSVAVGSMNPGTKFYRLTHICSIWSQQHFFGHTLLLFQNRAFWGSKTRFGAILSCKVVLKKVLKKTDFQDFFPQTYRRFDLDWKLWSSLLSNLPEPRKNFGATGEIWSLCAKLFSWHKGEIKYSSKLVFLIQCELKTNSVTYKTCTLATFNSDSLHVTSCKCLNSYRFVILMHL